jgi:hypothetical protein
MITHKKIRLMADFYMIQSFDNNQTMGQTSSSTSSQASLLSTYTKGRNIYSVWDDHRRYEFGTKQRVASKYIDNLIEQGYTFFVMKASIYGTAGFVLMDACLGKNIDCVILYDGMVSEIGADGSTKRTEKYKKYVQKTIDSFMTGKRGSTYGHIHVQQFPRGSDALHVEFVRHRRDHNAYPIPSGFSDNTFISMLATHIQSDATYKFMKISETMPREIWVAYGSGAVSKALRKAFPDSIIHTVRIYGDTSECNTIITGFMCHIPEEKSEDQALHIDELPTGLKSNPYYDAKAHEEMIEKMSPSTNSTYNMMWNVV